MFRSIYRLTVLSLGLPVFSLGADDNGSAAIVSYFTGTQVTVKIDMPGTQKGVDLRFNKAAPMDWKEYSSRLKQSGPAIHKGDISRVTTVVVKKDMIEFQLDGGGYGTFGDDTTTTVAPKVVEKSDYEKQLEKQISETDDSDKKAQLQRDLDRERARRQRQNAANESDAKVASEMKAQKLADKRQHGGSRFNLRWSGSIPADQLTPEAVMKVLADYIDFGNLQASPSAPPAQSSAVPAESAPSSQAAAPTAQLKRGMSIDDVTKLLSQGRQLSESTSNDGFKTQVFEYLPGDRRVEVTYVDGLVVRFAITSR
jgi:hypothetical protein